MTQALYAHINNKRKKNKIKEVLPSQWPPKTGRNSKIYLRQSRLQTFTLLK
jgi:hypothetical protein